MEFLNLHKNRTSPLWGVFGTLFIVFSLYTLLQIPFGSYLTINADGTYFIAYDNLDVNLNWMLVLLSLSFFGILIGLIFSMINIHKDKFSNLINATKKVDLQRVRSGFVFWSCLLLISFILDYFFISGSDMFIFRSMDINFIVLIFVSFVFLFVQTFAEEVLFRGYILQIFGSVFNRRWLPLLISGILFGLVHLTNPEVKEYGMAIMALHYFSAGIFLALIVVMDNRIELAVGFHAANNIISSTLLNFEGSVFKTYALFSAKEVDPYFGYIIWLMSAILFYFWMKKKYDWKPVSYIFGRIEKGVTYHQ